MNQIELSEVKSKAFLNLERSLIFFDLETTALDFHQDRIVELSTIKVNPDNSQSNLYFLLNPGIPIPAAASQIYGITNEDVS